MPLWLEQHLPWWLAALFFAHFIPFVVLSFHRKTWRFLPSVLTFLFLIILNVFRGLQLNPILLSWPFQSIIRTLALCFATLTIILFVNRQVQKKRSVG
jgi:hypothetical protein